MQNCLEQQIRRIIHMYIDDIIVKSTRNANLIVNHAETLANLRRYDIKLNLQKCVFASQLSS
jgi:hypothetical protein